MRRRGGTLLALATSLGGLAAFGGLVGGGVAVGATTASAPAPAAPRATAAITAYDIVGRRLPYDPDVRSNQLVRLVGTGFPANAQVTVYRPKLTRPAVVRSGRDGKFSYLYRIPTGLPNGQYSLTFAGPAVTGSARPIEPVTSSGTRDPQPITLKVPVVVVWPFLLDDPGQPSPTPSPSATKTAGFGIAGESTGPPRADGLSFTGVDVVGLVGVSLCAIALGALIWREGARRRSRRAA